MTNNAPAPVIEYPVFFNVTPHGPRFIAYVSENGKMFPIYFPASTDVLALEAAKKWASENVSTPERLARLAAIREARAERMSRITNKGVKNENSTDLR